MSAAALSEPEVLAGAKARLFPDPDAAGAYAVCDTQFAQESWLRDRAVADEIRERLAPFNHVRLGSGYPDLVGVRALEPDLLAVDRLDETSPPLVAVEAKGYTEAGTVDVRRGIVQAYDRLDEANAAYVAVPAPAVDQADRTLARELNVGVLAVRGTGTAGGRGGAGGVEVLETPRAVGTRASEGARAVRFQASARGVTDESFGLNHPKNYLGYPLALRADGDAATLLAEHDVVGAADEARRGAAFLGLVAETGAGPELTPLGDEVVRFALERCGGVEAALEKFADWYRSSTRFVDLAPAWGQLARRVVWDYPATGLLVEELQTMHRDGEAAPSLVDLVVWLHESRPAFAVELFLKGDEDVRGRALDADGRLRRAALEDGRAYHAPTVFQLKAMLYHVGLLTQRGAEPHRLDPTADVWRLRHPAADRPGG